MDHLEIQVDLVQDRLHVIGSERIHAGEGIRDLAGEPRDRCGSERQETSLGRAGTRMLVRSAVRLLAVAAVSM
jgi:hypothetical protein